MAAEIVATEAGKWIKSEATTHRCNKPHLKSDAPMASIGDLWECNTCQTVYRVTGFDSGMQWDPFPTVIKWAEYESWKSGPFPPGTK